MWGEIKYKRACGDIQGVASFLGCGGEYKSGYIYHVVSLYILKM